MNPEARPAREHEQGGVRLTFLKTVRSCQLYWFREPKFIANDWVQLLELLNKVWVLGVEFAFGVFGWCV
jgi:hypothetical protein